MKQFFGKKSRSALVMVLIVSLGLHIVAIVIFGTIKFVSDVLREETVFEAAPVELQPQKEPEYQVNIQQRNQSTPPSQPPTIVVNNPSELDIPALNIDVNVDSSSVYGRGGGGFGGGLEGVRNMAIDIEFFGATASGTNFAVLLDCTHSGADVFEEAREELFQTFRTIKQSNAKFMLIYFGGGQAGHVVGNKDFTGKDFWYPKGVSEGEWLDGDSVKINSIIRELRAVDPRAPGVKVRHADQLGVNGGFFVVLTQYWGAMDAAFSMRPPPSTVFFMVEPSIAFPNVKTVKRSWEWYQEYGRRKPSDTEVQFIVSARGKAVKDVEALRLMVNLVHGGDLSEKEINDLITYTQ
jgi:hypothetical protein